MSAATTTDAARLVSLALDPNRRADRDRDYGDLVAQYRTDPELRESTNAVADGMGLRILKADELLGLVLAARRTSPLAATPAWLRTELRANGVDQRMLFGLALIGVAAYCYPTKQSLDERAAVRFGLTDIDEFIVQRSAGLTATEGDSAADLSQAWQVWDDTPQTDRTERDGRLKKGCRLHYVQQACRLLEARALLVADTDHDDTWRPTDRFRLHLATHGGPAAYAAVVEMDADSETRLDVDGPEETT